MATLKRRSLNKVQQIPKRQTLKEKRKKRRMIVSFLAFFLIIFSVFGLAQISRKENFQISKIEIFGNINIGKDIIIEKVSSILEGKYFNLFNKAMVYILPKDRIESELKRDFPLIQDLRININNNDELLLEIIEKEAFALMCKDIQISRDCYLSDDDGIVFRKINEKEDFEYFDDLVIIVLPGIGQKYIGTAPINRDKYISLVHFVQNAQSNGIQAFAVTERLGIEYTMFIRNNTEEITNVYFNERESLSKQIENLILFYKEYESAQGGNFEYIDLRFGNNIVYKIK